MSFEVFAVAYVMGTIIALGVLVWQRHRLGIPHLLAAVAISMLWPLLAAGVLMVYIGEAPVWTRLQTWWDKEPTHAPE